MCLGRLQSSLWTSRSSLEKCLLVITTWLVAIIVLDTYIFSLMIKPKYIYKIITNTASDRDKICETKTCINAANHILRSIDPSIQPCQDFYSYACNNWNKNNPIPEGKSFWGRFAKLEEQNRNILKKLLERTEFNSSAMRKARLYYLSCMDENEFIETSDSEPIKELIRIVGGWNITDSDFKITGWTLQNALKVYNSLNIKVLFDWSVGEDPRNLTQHVLEIRHGVLVLPVNEFYANWSFHQTILSSYYDYMCIIGLLLGGELEQVKQQMKDILRFETKLANITTPSVHKDDELPPYELMTLRELQQKASYIDWRAYFDDAFQVVQRTFSDDEEIIIYDSNYLIKLANIIGKYNETDDGKIIINNYLVWKMINSFIVYLSKSYRDAHNYFNESVDRKIAPEKRWQYCVADTNHALSYAVSVMFVREKFDKDAKYVVQDIVDEVRNAFRSIILNSSWMDDESIKLAVQQLDSISDVIGLKDSSTTNLKDLDFKYRELEINSNQYFQNNIQINKFKLKKNLEMLDKPVNRSQVSVILHNVNAFYNKYKNEIVLPVSILQPPFFNSKNPKSLNFGSIGVVIGHEIAHAFEFEEHKIEKEATVDLNLWSNFKNVQRFNYHAACYERQYDKYQINGVNLDGTLTLQENIADSAGVNAAYRAFIKSESVSVADRLPLPGLNLTHGQLFFISFAQIWCSTATEYVLSAQIEESPHSPSKYRVIGALSNIKEFSKEFQCAPGTVMNPYKKCKIW